MLKNLETKITSVLLMALMLLTIAVPTVNATTLAQGVNVQVAYLPADANYHASNFQNIQGATVNLYNAQGTLLGSQTTDTNGHVLFTVPQGIQYYFTVSKSGYEQDWRAQNLGVSTVYQTHAATTTYAYDVFLKPTNSQSVTHVTPVQTTTTNRNNEPFDIYVYDEQGNRVSNAEVRSMRLSDNAYYDRVYTDLNGKATFYNSQFPSEIAVYFKATKNGKTYESINGVRFNKDADTNKGICQYTNTNEQIRCNVDSYALTKETTTTQTQPTTTRPTTNPTPSTQDGYYYVYVYDQNNNRIANTLVGMYDNNEKYLLGKYTDSNGMVYFYHQNFPENSQKIHFKTTKDGVEYTSPGGFAYYSENTGQFCNHWTGQTGNDYCSQSVAMTIYPPRNPTPGYDTRSGTFSFSIRVVDNVEDFRSGVKLYIYDKLNDKLIGTTSTSSDGYASFNMELNKPFYIKGEKVIGNHLNNFRSRGTAGTGTMAFVLRSTNSVVKICDWDNQNTCFNDLTANLYYSSQTRIDTNPTNPVPMPQLAALVIKAVDSNGNLVSNANVYVFDFNPVNGGRYLKSGYTGTDGKFYYYNAPTDRQLWVYAVTDNGRETNSCYSYSGAEYCQALQVSPTEREVTIYKAGSCYKDEKGNCYGTPQRASDANNYWNGQSTTKPIIVDNVQPPMPPEETNPVSGSYTINLNKGWNLVSNPYGEIKLVSTTCQLPVKAYSYNNFQLNYRDSTLYQNSVLDGHAYWMKANQDCTLTFEIGTSKPAVKTLQGTLLYNGWNLIGAPLNDEGFNAGECKVTSGPWSFENGQWQKSNTLVHGKAYFVKVADTCNLGQYTYTANN